MIELCGVSFSYDDRAVLHDVDLRVGAGELVGVLGPNGAGKSTLVRLALGLLAPTKGSVHVGGADLATLPRREIARRVAALVQDESDGFPMTVKECVLLGRVAHLPSHGFEGAEDLRAAQAAMDEVGVTALADRMLHAVSGGERRRVLFARALAQAAPALVLDEPVANLDLAHQLELFALLRLRATAGTAVLVTIHDLNLAARHCDRIVLVEGQGRPPSIGTPAEILTPQKLGAAFGVEIEIGHTAAGVPFYVATGATRRSA